MRNKHGSVYVSPRLSLVVFFFRILRFSPVLVLSFGGMFLQNAARKFQTGLHTMLDYKMTELFCTTELLS